MQASRNRRLKRNRIRPNKAAPTFISKIPKDAYVPIEESSTSSTPTTNIVTSVNISDYNIFYIHSCIISNLESKITSLPELRQELFDTLDILTYAPQDDQSQRYYATKAVDMLRRKIQDLEYMNELSRYLARTSDIISRYRTLIRDTSYKESFVTKLRSIPLELELQLKSLVNNFLHIAQEYITLENYTQYPQQLKCPACSSLSFERSIEDDSLFLCVVCKTEVEVPDDAPSFKDTDRVNMTSKYQYSKKGHFIDTAKRFQGIQNTDPKKIQNIVRIIKEQIDDHNLVCDQGFPNSCTKDHVYMFMEEQKLTKHYDDLNLIFYIITGVECPDISEYMYDLLEDFDKVEVVIQDILDSTMKTNTLNVNYKLYKLLQRRGCYYDRDSFYFLKTKAKEDEHDKIMKEAWDRLGWEWIPT